MEQLSEHDCKFPCCGKTTTLQELLNLSEWSSRHYLPSWYGKRYYGHPWIYLHCPHCEVPCYYLPGLLFVEVGFFGAAPVPDLIPVYEVLTETKVVQHEKSVEIEYLGNTITVPRSEKW